MTAVTANKDAHMARPSSLARTARAGNIGRSNVCQRGWFLRFRPNDNFFQGEKFPKTKKKLIKSRDDPDGRLQVGQQRPQTQFPALDMDTAAPVLELDPEIGGDVGVRFRIDE